VVLNGKFSTWKDVLFGVPLLSVLGPLLCVIFRNDIDKAVDYVDIVRKFADKPKLTRKKQKDKVRLQVALDASGTWASESGD
jgi:hypothetical protein